MKKILLLFFFIYFSQACSDSKEKNLDSQVIMMKVVKADPSARPVENDRTHLPITCDHYGEGCLNVTKVSLLTYNVLFIEFSSVKNAKEEAIKKKTMRYNNWLFDNISDEKILVNFFKKHLEAKFDHPEHDPFKN